jgi:hypothetical protein
MLLLGEAETAEGITFQDSVAFDEALAVRGGE